MQFTGIILRPLTTVLSLFTQSIRLKWASTLISSKRKKASLSRILVKIYNPLTSTKHWAPLQRSISANGVHVAETNDNQMHVANIITETLGCQQWRPNTWTISFANCPSVNIEMIVTTANTRFSAGLNIRNIV